jgi:AcrR family transcriptional regulator
LPAKVKLNAIILALVEQEWTIARAVADDKPSTCSMPVPLGTRVESIQDTQVPVDVAPSKKAKKSPVDSATRVALIDAVEALLIEEGYAAISTRKIGERAGVKSPLIHYYFNSIDDLYLAVFRRSIEASIEGAEAVLAGRLPLSSLWSFESEPRAKLGSELTALANHRPALKAELAAYGERMMDIQVAAVERRIAQVDVKPQLPPVVAVMLLNSVTRELRLENALGLSRGHAETRAYLQKWLDRFEMSREAQSDLELG